MMVKMPPHKSRELKNTLSENNPHLIGAGIWLTKRAHPKTWGRKKWKIAIATEATPPINKQVLRSFLNLILFLLPAV
jgi:hypothetical protein